MTGFPVQQEALKYQQWLSRALCTVAIHMNVSLQSLTAPFRNCHEVSAVAVCAPSLVPYKARCTKHMLCHGHCTITTHTFVWVVIVRSQATVWCTLFHVVIDRSGCYEARQPIRRCELIM